MRRRVAILGAVVAAAGAGIVAMPNANAASVCVQYDINVNGTGQAGEVCTPEAPALPELPGAPTLP
jgi:hypothetical protein